MDTILDPFKVGAEPQQPPVEPIVELERVLNDAYTQIEAIKGREVRLLGAVTDLEIAESRHRNQIKELESEIARERAGHNAIISALDSVDAAIAAAIGATDPGPFHQGILMIKKQFIAALEQLGIKQIPVAAGDEFNPELHEAMGIVQGPGKTVVSVTRAGFVYTTGQMAGKLVRAAGVMVGAS